MPVICRLFEESRPAADWLLQVQLVQAPRSRTVLSRTARFTQPAHHACRLEGVSVGQLPGGSNSAADFREEKPAWNS